MAKTLRNRRINQIIYLSLGGALLAIIVFIILFNKISSKNNNSNNDLQIGQKNSIDEYIEQASSSIGKKVDEEYEEVQEGEDLQIQLNNENTEKDKLDSRDDNNKENTINQNNQDLNSEKNSNTNIANQDNSDDSTISTNSTETNQIVNNVIDDSHQNQSENSEESGSEQKDPIFVMPVDGEVVKHYGKEKLIYSDTLKEWTTHLGIDIKADKTTVVKVASDGVVKSIKNDPRYGLTVVVEHANGFSSVYSNLLTAEFVVVGENVKAGQTLGTVGNSATFEILDDSHLHFEILKDGNSVDPEMYIK